MPDYDYPLRPICSMWIDKIQLAAEHKKKRFQLDADEAMNFFNGPHDFMYETKYAASSRGFVLSHEEDSPDPTFRMTVNRVAEMVQLFGPVLYHKNPIRQVNPRQVPAPPIELFGDPQNPMVQLAYMQAMQPTQQIRAIDKARSLILQFYLNYTPTELNLKTQSRRAIDEAIIKGMGVLWTELYRPKGSNVNLVGSFFDTIDNLFIDPDMETIEDANWIARKCTNPNWAVEMEYGLKPGTLRGSLESYTAQAASFSEDDADYQRKRGLSNDLTVYYKIFSKMGIGARLSGTAGSASSSANSNVDQLRETLDTFGEYCFLVVVPGVPYPLNIPPELINQPGKDQEILQRLEWPTPFWAANDSWPFTAFKFHEIPRQVWPMSHLKPAMGEMKFINWAYSFLASKIRTTCRDFIAVLKAAGEEIKAAIQSGQDLTIIELEHQYPDIAKVIQFLKHPEMNTDVWKVIEAVEHNFEKRVGLTELVYGMSAKQMRSAQEADLKGSQIQVRPDDMANKVEDAMTEVARKEALAARWHIKPEDVAPVMGPLGAQLWAQLVVSSDINEVVHQLEYRIEAGSTRKPNKDRDAANMKEAMQALFGPIMQYAVATWDFTAVNRLIVDWAKSIDLNDPEGYLFKPPPPPPLVSGPGAGNGPPGASPAAPNGQRNGAAKQPVPAGGGR